MKLSIGLQQSLTDLMQYLCELFISTSSDMYNAQYIPNSRRGIDNQSRPK